MTALSLLSGVLGGENAQFNVSYPLNLEPKVIDIRLSKGQLMPAAGASLFATGPGDDRGGITWNDQLYRVMGDQLCRIGVSGQVTPLGSVGFGDGKRCGFDYSFDRLAIRSGEALWHFNGVTLTQVTDEDLGAVRDFIWIDGYFMTTDGVYVLVNELNDPTQIKPLKYGSAEEDPDPVTGLLKYRSEAYVLGRYSIEVLANVGGNGFPFQVNRGAGIPFGCIGPLAKCLFGDSFAFVGSARGERLNVFVAGQGTAQPIGTGEVCDALAKVSDLSSIELEVRESKGEKRLTLHLPGESWVFMLKASTEAGTPIWYRVKTDEHGYRLRAPVVAYGKTIVGDPLSGRLGEITETDSRHYGEEVEWQFDCGLLNNEGFGGIVHSVELVGLPGRGYDEGVVFMSMTRDGETFTQERAVSLGRRGARTRRIQWRPHSRFTNYLGLRFRGRGMAGMAACEVKAQGLEA